MQALDARAREILLLNDRGGYTVPTDGLYPYQWNWDSMVAAWGFAAFDLDRAWQEVERLFSGQWPNGMVPHILFHRPDPGYFPGPDVWGTAGRGPLPSSGITQPPVAASFVRRLWEKDRGRPEAEALFEPLLAWHRWFMEWRCEGGAIFVTHPWEAGRDNAPDWDGAMAAIEPAGVQPYTRRDTAHVDASMRPTRADYDRYIWLVERGRRLGWDEAAMAEGAPFRVADPGMTFILMGACRDLAALGRGLGRDVAEIGEWIGTLERGAESLWNPAIGAYDGRDLGTGAFAGALTNASYLCWLGGVDDERMLAKFDGMLGRVPYPVASLDPADPRFDARRYWRGPTWAIMNALIGLGLAEMGHAAQAQALRRRTAQLIAEHAFAEYFDPLTGAPAGGGTFTWTAAVWLAWASPRARGA
ncbi:hypothetical protein DLJ49_00070 [Rhodovulum sp. 12E13]|nr:hypothetical protein DLJ49_00070 [Rhodovulum sp. 12E13]